MAGFVYRWFCNRPAKLSFKVQILQNLILTHTLTARDALASLTLSCYY